MFTLQDCFNAAWHHFIENQNPPSVSLGVWSDGKYKPVYNNGTNKCAIGLLTDDLKYWDGSIQELFTEQKKEFKDLIQQFNVNSVIEGIEAWQEAQNRLHDDLINYTTGEWACSFQERKDSYIQFAQEFALKIPNEH